jgi:transcription elongation factor GreA-like protein
LTKETSIFELNDILEVAKRTNYGWDCILQSIINLGTFLMDQKEATSISHMDLQRGAKLHDCGMEVLLHICGMNESIKMDILEHIFTRIMIKAENVHHYIELLKKIINKNKGILMSQKSSFSKVFVSFLILVQRDH